MVFARVEEKERTYPGTNVTYKEYSVTEYPVMLEHIVNRGHPMAWYKEVVPGPMPAVEAYQKLDYKLAYDPVNDKVLLNYGVVEKVLVELLSEIYKNSPTDPIFIDAVAPDMIQRVVNGIKTFVEDRLNNWVKQKDYKSIESCCDYRDDPVFGADGVLAFQKRRETWLAVYAYQDQVTTLALPVPRDLSDIIQHLPELIWPDVVGP